MRKTRMEEKRHHTALCTENLDLATFLEGRMEVSQQPGRHPWQCQDMTVLASNPQI